MSLIYGCVARGPIVLAEYSGYQVLLPPSGRKLAFFSLLRAYFATMPAKYMLKHPNCVRIARYCSVKWSAPFKNCESSMPQRFNIRFESTPPPPSGPLSHPTHLVRTHIRTHWTHRTLKRAIMCI